MKHLALGIGLALAFSATASAQNTGSTTVAAADNTATFLAPASFQYPREVTGKVRVMRASFGNGPSTPSGPVSNLLFPISPPTTVLVGNQVISGKLATELLGFEDEEVVVRGFDRIDFGPVVPFTTQPGNQPGNTGSVSIQPPPFNHQIFEGQSFAPVAELKAQELAAGHALDYLTGIITVEKKVVDIGKDQTSTILKVSVDALTGESFQITDTVTANRFAGLDPDGNPIPGASDADGATVTLFGRIIPHSDPSAVERQFENLSTRIMARGKLSPLFHIMGATDAAALRTAAPGSLTPLAQPMIAIWPPRDWADFGLSITSRNATGEKFFPLYKGAGLTIPPGALNGNQTHWVTIEVGDKLTLQSISKFPVELSPIGVPFDGAIGTNVPLTIDTVPAGQPAGQPAVDGGKPSGLNRGSTAN